MPSHERPRDPLTLLREASLEVLGRMPDSSNATFLVRLCLPGDAPVTEAATGRIDELGPGDMGVYKPGQGERALWDFPSGLYRREVAAYELSEALGWRIVPPTVLRDGPLGEGSVQWFVRADFAQHHFTLVEHEHHHEQLKKMAVFDILANNTDRKSGHCLLDADGHIWGIDNGLCFATDFKLRTVIWDFAGEPIDSDLLDDVARVIEDLPPGVADLLRSDELDALCHRGHSVLRAGRFPVDTTGRRYPWPLV